MKHSPLRSLVVSGALAGLALGSSIVMAAPSGADNAPPTAPVPGSDVSPGPQWHAVGPEPGSTPLVLDIALRLPDPAGLERFVAAVSSPGSSQYHHYLRRGTFATAFGPATEEISAVQSWLAQSGVSGASVSPDHLFVQVHVTAAQATSLLHFSLGRFQHDSGRLGYAPLTTPMIPAALSQSVSGIVGLSDLAQAHSMAQTPSSQSPGSAVENSAGAPSTLLHAASTPTACSAATSAGNTYSAWTIDQEAGSYRLPTLYNQGRYGDGTTIALFELESYTASDIATFQSCFGTNSTVSSVLIDGGPPQTTASQGGEAALDIEDVVGIAPHAKVLVYEGKYWQNATATNLLDVWDGIANDDLAQVVSTSWGMCEASAQQFSASFLSSERTVLSSMAAQGQSVQAASGDFGSEDCFPNTGLGVDDPGSQQYVVSAGGTSLTSLGPPPVQAVWNNCQGQTVSCANSNAGGAGGGGISNVWTMPSWQSGVVNVQSSRSACGQSVTGPYCREVPDVSATADPYHGLIVYFSGSLGGCHGWCPIGGTSMASPLWTAFLALSNQGCASPVGFADPLLYHVASQQSSAFSDVVSGNDDYTDTNSGKYAAASEFDMASGWGTPVATTLLPLLQPAGGCPTVIGLSATTGPSQGTAAVTISGSDLAAATSVHFGSSAARFTVNGSGASATITALSPPNSPGSVDVTVTDPGGTSAAVAADRFTYLSSSSNLFDFAADGAGSSIWNAYDRTVTAAGPTVSGTPSALVVPGGVDRVYVQSSNGDLVEYADDNAGGQLWNAYDLSQTAGGGGPVAGTPSALNDAAQGLVHVYVRAVSGHLVEYVDDNAGGHVWNAYDLSFYAGAGSPVAGAPSALYDAAQGLVHTYVESSSGHLVEYVNDNAGGHLWNAYDLTVYSGAGVPVAGAPSALYDAAQGLVHVYVEGASGDLVEFVNDSAYGHLWNAYDLTVYSGAGVPVAGAPSALYDEAQGLVHIYVEASSGHLAEWVNDNAWGHLWNSYDLTAYSGGGVPVTGAPSALYDAAQGLVHIYVDGASGHLVEYVNDNAGGHLWNAYDLTSATGGPVTGSSPSAVVNGTVIDVYVRSS